MTIKFVGGNASYGKTTTMPAHQAGDLIFVCAFRTGSDTAPTVPSGWSSRPNSGSSPEHRYCSQVVGWRIAEDAGTTTGTWSNATGVAIAVYRCDNGFLPGGSDTFVTLGAATSNGMSDTIYWNAGLADIPNLISEGYTVWQLGAAGHSAATSLLSTVPAGFTVRSGGAAVAVPVIADTGPISAWVTGTQSVPLGGWRYTTILFAELPGLGGWFAFF